MSLGKPGDFFKAMRAGLLGPDLTQSEVDGCNAILAAIADLPLSHAAYCLATAYHETASTMKPIREYGGPTYFTRMYDVAGARKELAIANGNTCAGDGPKYCGRGYVQLTWKNNYKRAGDKLGVDLVANPELAMQPDIAAKIMRYGMAEGWFTGKKLGDHLPVNGRATEAQYTAARRIINGVDRAELVAGHALKFEEALIAGGWS
jgi:putative chitinase